MQVCVVIFRRFEDAVVERGIGLSIRNNAAGDLDMIVDSKGREVPAPIWSFTALPFTEDYQSVLGKVSLTWRYKNHAPINP